MEGLGFKKVEAPVEVTEEVIETAPVEETPVEEVVIETPVVEVVEPVETPVVEAVVVEAPVVTEPIKPVIEKEIIDPFKDLGDKEKQIFDALKNKDFKTIKEYLDVTTADYDQMSDHDSVREQLKLTKPKWTPEMIDMELQEKYGVGLDEEELTDAEVLKYKKNLIDASDLARDFLKSRQSELTFPSIEKVEVTPVVDEAPKYTPEELVAFQAVWDAHVQKGIGELTDEKIDIEVDNDGNKEVFDFPVAFTDSDKSALQSLVRDFDINKDFTERYVKDGQIDVTAFARDKFKADNADKLIKSAFAQGFSKGKIAQLKTDKNIDLGPTGGGVSGDMTDNKTEAVKSFFGNGKTKR